jgi:hypothetical protein
MFRGEFITKILCVEAGKLVIKQALDRKERTSMFFRMLGLAAWADYW